MNKKWPLFAGIVLLVTGVLLRIFADLGHLPIFIIITGASFKIYYVILKIRDGEYKPGFEVFLLYLGLVLFFTGVFMKNHHARFNHLYLMMSEFPVSHMGNIAPSYRQGLQLVYGAK